MPAAFLPTGLGHVGTTATATVDQTRDLLDHVTGVETGLDGVIGAGSEQGRVPFSVTLATTQATGPATFWCTVSQTLRRSAASRP